MEQAGDRLILGFREGAALHEAAERLTRVMGVAFLR